MLKPSLAGCLTAQPEAVWSVSVFDGRGVWFWQASSVYRNIFNISFHFNFVMFTRQVQCAKMAAGLYALRGDEMAHERTGAVTMG